MWGGFAAHHPLERLLSEMLTLEQTSAFGPLLEVTVKVEAHAFQATHSTTTAAFSQAIPPQESSYSSLMDESQLCELTRRLQCILHTQVACGDALRLTLRSIYREGCAMGVPVASEPVLGLPPLEPEGADGRRYYLLNAEGHAYCVSLRCMGGGAAENDQAQTAL